MNTSQDNTQKIKPDVSDQNWWGRFVKFCKELQAVIAIVGVAIVAVPFIVPFLKPNVHFGERQKREFNQSYTNVPEDGFVMAVASAAPSNGYFDIVGDIGEVGQRQRVANAAGNSTLGNGNPNSISFMV